MNVNTYLLILRKCDYLFLIRSYRYNYNLIILLFVFSVSWPSPLCTWVSSMPVASTTLPVGVFTYNAKPHRYGALHALGGLRDLGRRGAVQMNGLGGLQQRDLLSEVAKEGRRRGIGIRFPCPLENI